MVYGKTVCKGLFSDGIYICGMHFNWSVVSETEFYGYEYCNHIYSGVLLTSIVTDGYLCSVAGSFLSVFLFCFFLTEPRMSFKTYAVGYPVTFS